MFFASTAQRLAWVAEEGDPGAPDTTFRNVKPGLFLRWWRQVRQKTFELIAVDEEWEAPAQEPIIQNTRMEQITYTPLSSYGSVPGSYTDPILYNTKSTSPFRWNASPNNFDVAGHWYMEADEIFRVKEWKPKNPDDPWETPPRPPNMRLQWDESVDEQGNRVFRYKYKYEYMDPHFNLYPAYPFSHHYTGVPGNRDKIEGYGFKQGHLLRCDKDEEEVLRRIMEEEDREWDMVRRTEIYQAPFNYPGKTRPIDLLGSINRAKARWKQAVREGRPTDPSKDPNYDVVMAGEQVEPRDGPRAEWRHLWTSNRQGKPLEYQNTGNDGLYPEANENKPPPAPPIAYGPNIDVAKNNPSHPHV